MLSIRDERVRTLAQDLMQKTGAPTITAAIRQALENEISRASEEPTFQEKIKTLQDRVRSMAKHPPDRNYVDSRDDLWDN
ncbi:type II toxin-antitoxin system VapB family antitoxin [Rhizobium sp. TH2]|uniref:type II toxin-antitoxin system VapB family antitoxin n=1 Tax=Rhizobium sp. TH2 TaxID=2775403 RepID=UPI002157BCDA|nr:type II toxin-antitoxin system VapB family antitoxin [Rhizobium sp. TH2]UVC08193.1 type II toxin-antitoxin system VapB family antitoxin [Rhizobium sp. TH2]